MRDTRLSLRYSQLCAETLGLSGLSVCQQIPNEEAGLLFHREAARAGNGIQTGGKEGRQGGGRYQRHEEAASGSQQLS